MAKKKPTYSGYQNSGYYSAANIAALQQLAANYSLDQTALRQQAEAALKPTYDQQVLSAQQQLQQAMGGYTNQLSGLGLAYEQQRRAANSQYDQSGSQALNQLTKRNLGRSSVVGTTLGSIESARGQSLYDIGAKEGDAYSDIYNNMSLAQNQNAATLKQYSDSYGTQLDARVNELYNTNNAALANLQAQIAQIQAGSYNNYVSNLNKQNKGGGGGSHRSSGSSGTKPPATPTYDYSQNYDKTNQGGSGASGWFASGAR